jgi:hypothetical protein
MKNLYFVSLFVIILFTNCTNDNQIGNRQISKEKISSEDYIEYSYNNDRLSIISQYDEGYIWLTKYFYDDDNNIIKSEYISPDGTQRTVNYLYDEMNRIIRKEYDLPPSTYYESFETYYETFEYTSQNSLNVIRYGDGEEVGRVEVELINNRISSMSFKGFPNFSDEYEDYGIRYEIEYDTNLNLSSVTKYPTFENNDLYQEYRQEYTYYDTENPFYNQLNSIYIDHILVMGLPKVFTYGGYNYPYNTNILKSMSRDEGFINTLLTYDYSNEKPVELNGVSHYYSETTTLKVKYEY